MRLGLASASSLIILRLPSSWIFVIIVLHVEIRLLSFPNVAYETTSSIV